MDGQTRFYKIRELETELQADGLTDERAKQIFAEMRKLKAADKSAKKPRAPKKERERYMTVLGGYVLDMHNHGHLVGYRNEEGGVVSRTTGRVIA